MLLPCTELPSLWLYGWLQVCISYEKKPLNLGWTVQSDKWHTWRMLSQPWTTAYVDIMPLYLPSPAQRNDPKLYAESVSTAMVRACLGWICTVPVRWQWLQAATNFGCARQYCITASALKSHTCAGKQESRCFRGECTALQRACSVCIASTWSGCCTCAIRKTVHTDM